MMTEQGVQTLRQICAAPETQRNSLVTLYTEQPSGVPNMVRLIDCNFGHVMYQVNSGEIPSQTGPGFTTEKAVENMRKICSDNNKAPGF